MSDLLKTIVKCTHHEQFDLCTTRPLYRQGRRLTAVKVPVPRQEDDCIITVNHAVQVYSVVSESQHLLVSGVPAVGLQDEIRSIAAKHGDILSLSFVPGYAEESFVDAFHLQYARIQSARHAKRQLDGLSFMGGVLHVCYAPELETVEEVRAKLTQRRRDVANKIRQNLQGQKGFTKSGKYRTPLEMLPQSSSQSVPCIWNGELKSSDPRVTPIDKVYGPELPKNNGEQNNKLSETSRVFPSSSSITSNTSKFVPRQVRIPKKTFIRNTWREPTGNLNDPMLQPCRSADASSKRKVEELAEQSVNSTILTVRQKIRAITVPNAIIFRKNKNI